MIESLESRRLLSNPAIIDVSLINVGNDSSFGNLASNSTYNSDTHNLNILVDAKNTTRVDFELDGKYHYRENIRPYFIFGDKDNLPRQGNISYGQHELIITPYRNNHKGNSKEFIFSVSNIVSPPKHITFPVPVEPPTIVYSAPITITKGGTYTGNWDSENPDIPSVSVKTSDPVIIINSNIIGKSDLIHVYNKANITIKDTYGSAENPNVKNDNVGHFAVIDNGFSKIDIENNELDQTSGIQIDGNNGTNGIVDVLYNKAHNIDGRLSNGNGGYILTNGDSDYIIAQFVQISNEQSVSAEIAWNQITNDKGNSRVEDNINIYDSTGTSADPILIHDNFIYGAYKAQPTVSDSNGYAGGGIIADYKANYVQIVNNIIIDTTNYGVAIADGQNNQLNGNIVLYNEVLPDTNVGIYIWNTPSYTGPWGNNSGTNNQVDTANDNDWWVPDASSWTGNVHINTTLSQQQNNWNSKLSANNITIGLN